MPTSPLDHWKIEYNSGTPVYRQIVTFVATAVATGALNSGDRLPTIRALCERLNVNPNTVAKAYRELDLRGLIAGERGNGSYISSSLPVAPGGRSERRATLQRIYDRMLADAASLGLSEKDIIEFIQERNPYGPNR